LIAPAVLASARTAAVAASEAASSMQLWTHARNDAGCPMFNMFGQRCVGMWDDVGSNYSDHGTCTYTDKDGDHIFMPYSAKSGHGTYEVAGGPGKFVGITGTGEYLVKP
jgi:hypothetical protein